jgi:excisionase family DNA binding protein
MQDPASELPRINLPRTPMNTAVRPQTAHGRKAMYTTRSSMDRAYALQTLRQALKAQRGSLKKLQDALIEFEATISGEAPHLSHESGELQLLSVHEVCQQLGMGKSWVYRRLGSGEIPSVKLGRSIKVRREDLEAYLEQHRHAVNPAQNSS